MFLLLAIELPFELISLHDVASKFIKISFICTEQNFYFKNLNLPKSPIEHSTNQ